MNQITQEYLVNYVRNNFKPKNMKVTEFYGDDGGFTIECNLDCARAAFCIEEDVAESSYYIVYESSDEKIYRTLISSIDVKNINDSISKVTRFLESKHFRKLLIEII